VLMVLATVAFSSAACTSSRDSLPPGQPDLTIPDSGAHDVASPDHFQTAEAGSDQTTPTADANPDDVTDGPAGEQMPSLFDGVCSADAMAIYFPDLRAAASMPAKFASAFDQEVAQLSNGFLIAKLYSLTSHDPQTPSAQVGTLAETGDDAGPPYDFSRLPNFEPYIFPVTAFDRSTSMVTVSGVTDTAINWSLRIATSTTNTRLIVARFDLKGTLDKTCKHVSAVQVSLFVLQKFGNTVLGTETISSLMGPPNARLDDPDVIGDPNMDARDPGMAPNAWKIELAGNGLEIPLP